MLKQQEGLKYIWDANGDLVPLTPAPEAAHHADVAAIIVSRNRKDLVDAMVKQLKSMGRGLKMDIFVVEMGTDEDKLSEHCSLRYDDDDFRGKCYGHNVGLRLARSRGRYRYYWILMNDLVFEDGFDAIGELVRLADANPKLAILSPTEHDGACPDGKPVEGGDFHLVSSCDYLSFLLRAECVDEAGFMNPEFRYCWGALHEFSYKLYSKGWQVAYCDRVTMKHLGGTTYGKAKNTVSREEYQKRAKEFAARYFVEHYGKNWDEDFAKVLPPGLKYNFFKSGRKSWESVFEKKEDKGLTGKMAGAVKRLLKGEKKEKAAGDLARQIEALNPWYYEIEIGGIKITPGEGSKQSAEELRGRVRYRTKLIVDEVAKRYDFKGKRLLDIASNCGYWSARYAEHGAVSLLAVEGRADYVEQGRLYWGHNRFVLPGAFEFMRGNVMERETWDRVREKGPFDFTLCCGILYHIPDYEKVLRHIASVTREAVLIDTRVSEDEKLVEEPGGWCFDAIIETRLKKNPNLERMERIMKELGFSSERLSINEPTPVGLAGADDYNKGNRIALLCKKDGK